MEANFYDSINLPKEKLQELITKKDKPATIQFVTVYLLFIATSIGVVLTWQSAWVYFIIAQVAYGLVVCSVFAGEHETVHLTVFKSKKINQIAAFLFGVAHIYPSSIFRALHYTHHRYTQIPGKDPEISLGNKPAPSVISNFPMYLSWLSGFPLLSFKVMMLFMTAMGTPEIVRKNMLPFIHPSKRGKIALESLFILALYIGLFSLAYFYYPNLWAIGVGQIVGHCFLGMYLIMEHNGLPHEGNILEKTRSINAPKVVKKWMWNMPYHAEHHAYPAVPFYALPALHEEIKSEIKHKDESHSSFHLKVIRQTLLGKRD